MGSLDTANGERMTVRLLPSQSQYDVKRDGLGLNDVTTNTALVSAQHHFEGTQTKPLVTPIYHASTYVVDKLEDALSGIVDGGPMYSRLGNPTAEMTECAINTIERGAGSLTFSSGMAAVSSIFLSFLKTGDHVIYQIPSYPGTYSALRHLNHHFNVEQTKLKEMTPENVEKSIKPNTKLVWVETPCNPEIIVSDIAGIAKVTQAKGILFGVDGTFASPYLQRAIPLGVDFAMHSCTKYMGGHSDLMAGSVTTRTVEQWRVLKHTQTTYGNMLSPHDANMLLRGLKTLSLRMQKHNDNAQKIAEYLEKHPKVARVSYPGLPSHPQHEIAKKQMQGGFSGMIMAEIKGGEKGGRVVAENMKVFRLAVSLGGVQSILEHPYTMTHGKYLLTPEETEESGVTPGMLRISVGIEDAEDLIKDFEQALEKLEL